LQIFQKNFAIKNSEEKLAEISPASSTQKNVRLFSDFQDKFVDIKFSDFV
jgi:hypothetical protein